MSTTRYPGAQPFKEAQQNIFFGRQQATAGLYRLIRQEPLVVLYAKSGLGKSSLLNAGIIPKVRKAGKYKPLPIRFLAWTGEEEMPIVKANKAVRGGKATITTFLDQLLENEQTLWHDLKEQQLLAPKGEGILLIFDQFEELFTYPPAAQLAFRKQLAEALYTPVPQRYWDLLDLYTPDTMPFSTEQLAQLQQPLDLRVVVSIRQDRMHLLGNLSDYLPTISKNWYELSALDERSARAAITQPANKEGNFDSEPFSYEPAAIDKLIHFLTDEGEEKIESTQLQIVCNSIEQKVINQHLQTVSVADIGDLEEIIASYYEEKINAIASKDQQLAARKLIEEGLIFEEEERRLSLYEGQILKGFDIEKSTLRTLVDSHLLRAEPSLRGGYTYELSHDTLVPPVLKSKAQRKEVERQAELEQQRLSREKALQAAEAKAEAERQRAEQEAKLRQQAEANEGKAKRLTRLAIIVSVIALLAAALAAWAYVQAEAANRKAVEAQTEALEAQKNAEQNLANFQKEQKEKQELKLDQLQQYIQTYIDAEEYWFAINSLKKALAMDPEDKELQRLLVECKKKKDEQQQ